jgi:hypothetical protein
MHPATGFPFHTALIPEKYFQSNNLNQKPKQLNYEKTTNPNELAILW